ncbi:hypothetical protein ANANG_G00245590 [Anguilla anguilla]|uniref:G-protein coupled receptors family 1 profile domain-containing protein n=1 Tax=Anguilla anguilla TaxID=7936 RepID=A0A9D3RM70_ANGAN|nr:hypothetical protein ANANG_G00245590 [Anguilla anguilla]
MDDEMTTLEEIGMGLRVNISPTQTTFYVMLVLFGILGNGMVVGVVGESVIRDSGSGKGSDIILVNMALSNLLVSLMRNSLLVLSDLGLETLRRVAPSGGHSYGPRGPSKPLLLGLGSIWAINLLYSIPAFMYSTSGDRNSTETLMLISSTTRPLLGCVWNFPSPYGGLAYATISMVIHETLPIILMSITNLGSLYTLYAHGRKRAATHVTQNAPVIRRVPAERRAAKVILALIMLFIVSWGTSIISVNYFNYNRGSSAEFLLVVARFANTAFIALSPMVLAIGHRRLRAFIRSVIVH